jgi:hypothetical protein
MDYWFKDTYIINNKKTKEESSKGHKRGFFLPSSTYHQDKRIRASNVDFVRDTSTPRHANGGPLIQHASGRAWRMAWNADKVCSNGEVSYELLHTLPHPFICVFFSSSKSLPVFSWIGPTCYPALNKTSAAVAMIWFVGKEFFPCFLSGK